MLSTLIVEDDALHRVSTHQLLARHFPSMLLVEAASGKEALRQMAVRRFDLLCLTIRQPWSGDLVLIEAVKTFFAESVVCVIACHDTERGREAALRHGADYFMAESDAMEGALVGLIESLLCPRFRTLIVDSDGPSRSQIHALFSIRWPAMIVADVADAAAGVAQAAALKPDLVLLELGEAGVDAARGIRRGNPHATLIGLADDASPPCRNRYGVDHCVPLSAAGHTELMTIVKSMQPQRLLAQ